MHCSWMKSRITAAGKARRQQEYVEHNSDSRMTARNYIASLSSSTLGAYAYCTMEPWTSMTKR